MHHLDCLIMHAINALIWKLDFDYEPNPWKLHTSHVSMHVYLDFQVPLNSLYMIKHNPKKTNKKNLEITADLCRARKIAAITTLKLIREIKIMLLYRWSEDGASLSDDYEATVA